MKIKIIAGTAAVALVGILAITRFDLKPLGDQLGVNSPTPSVSSLGTRTPTPTALPGQTKLVLLEVPFISQAPFGNWSDPKEQNGCEEASVIMAMGWVRGTKTISASDALKEIVAISDFEQEKYGQYIDTSAQDTADRIFKDYFNYDNVQVQYDVSIEDIAAALAAGKLVVAPMNGRELHNPNYTPPGPLEHMLVIKGYDPAKKQFITNDPGTRKGQGYRYDQQVLFNAIYDYDTGGTRDHGQTSRNAIIIVSK